MRAKYCWSHEYNKRTTTECPENTTEPQSRQIIRIASGHKQGAVDSKAPVIEGPIRLEDKLLT